VTAEGEIYDDATPVRVTPDSNDQESIWRISNSAEIFSDNF
jgi:hypothetical protein